MTAPQPSSWPKITGPSVPSTNIGDPLAFIQQEAESLIETVIKDVGPASAVAAQALKFTVMGLGVLVELRGPLNGKDAQRWQELTSAYAASDWQAIADRYNADPVEPTWMRSAAKFLLIIAGMPAASFPS